MKINKSLKVKNALQGEVEPESEHTGRIAALGSFLALLAFCADLSGDSSTPLTGMLLISQHQVSYQISIWARTPWAIGVRLCLCSMSQATGQTRAPLDVCD